MPAGAYQFPLGTFSCIALSDGALNYDLHSFFANVDREEVATVLRRDGLPDDRIMTPYTCLFVDTGEHRVLIDTGAGNLGEAVSKMFPDIDHSTTITGLLHRNLRDARIDPATIDTIIITHAHPDHVGGTLDESGSLLYPGARYAVSRAEWEFWFSDEAAERAPAPFVATARRNLEAMQGNLTLVDDGDVIVPGIRVMSTPGHTPGHIALEISSGEHSLLHVSDVVLHPLHLEHPDWLPVFDMLPAEAETSKRRTFDRATEQGVLVFGHHFPPFPNLGHVRKEGDGWRWEPVDPVA